ncbi:hypothetical protein BpHYR1_003845 [Brachionus plicatilis]|uniref:Uncharacterized protein n=1 Tax=Brachionus plicatilis TaxID=10195 RepID=A0A3M7RWY3_BRAPC|nr:hypothetical protein BpHYR1_003845 [Brachionus plicatilis]
MRCDLHFLSFEQFIIYTYAAAFQSYFSMCYAQGATKGKRDAKKHVALFTIRCDLFLFKLTSIDFGFGNFSKSLKYSHNFRILTKVKSKIEKNKN